MLCLYLGQFASILGWPQHWIQPGFQRKGCSFARGSRQSERFARQVTATSAVPFPKTWPNCPPCFCAGKSSQISSHNLLGLFEQRRQLQKRQVPLSLATNRLTERIIPRWGEADQVSPGWWKDPFSRRGDRKTSGGGVRWGEGRKLS